MLFNAFVLAMLRVDLAVFHRKAHELRFKEALAWSAVWVVLGLFLTWEFISRGVSQAACWSFRRLSD